MEIWKNLTTQLYPGDEFLIEEDRRVYFKNFKEYIGSPLFGDPNDNRFHIGLKPVPYEGNLENALIYYLSLNPGFSPSDYEQNVRPEFEERYYKNMKQEEMSYPFFALDPLLCSSGGYTYWIKKLRSLIKLVKINEELSWLEAQQRVSEIFAVLELVPYPSNNFYLTNSKLYQMSSVKVIKQFVEEQLVPKAEKGEVLILITRKRKLWGIEEGKNIIIYGPGQALSASLGENSKAYQAIRRFLKYK